METVDLSNSSSDTIDPLPPPQQWLQQARQMKPDVSQQELFAAWDKSDGVGAGTGSSTAGYDPTSARVQAAFGYLFDSPSAEAANQRRPPPRQRSPSPRPPPVASSSTELRRRQQPLFRPRSPSPDPLSASPPSPAKKQKLPPPRLTPAAIARQALLDLSDDEEWSARPNKSLRAYKAEARKLDRAAAAAAVAKPPPPVISLDQDEEEDEDEVMVYEPPPPSLQDVLASILNVVPDVLPSHVLDRLNEGQKAEMIVESLLGGEYPRLEGAVKAEVKKVEPEKDWLDVAERARAVPDLQYRQKALEQLYLDYTEYATSDIKKVFKSPECSFLYAPAWMKLRQMKKDRSLSKISKPRAIKPVDPKAPIVLCPEFENEMTWLGEKIQKERTERRRRQKEERIAQAEAERMKQLDEQAEKDGTAVECQCCFGNYHDGNMTHCAARCASFCRHCALANAKERLGNGHHTLPCLAACGADFSESEARRFLTAQTMELWHKIRMEKEVDAAGLEGLEKCPFCPYAAVIENPDERLFHCEREGCGKTSCRKCHEVGHVPLSCEEAQKEKKLPGIHQVEEAMTAALIRPCPRCKVAIIKADGCNHMTCSKCGAESCFICRADITGNHSAHFRNNPRCPGSDDTLTRTYNEVESARLAALAKLDPSAVDMTDAQRIADEAPHRPPPPPPPPLPLGPAWPPYPYFDLDIPPPPPVLQYAPPPPPLLQRAMPPPPNHAGQRLGGRASGSGSGSRGGGGSEAQRRARAAEAAAKRVREAERAGREAEGVRRGG